MVQLFRIAMVSPPGAKRPMREGACCGPAGVGCKSRLLGATGAGPLVVVQLAWIVRADYSGRPVLARLWRLILGTNLWGRRLFTSII